jgi:non-specific serine/threonine protein kinase
MLSLSPKGRLALTTDGEHLAIDDEMGARLAEWFAAGHGHGLLHLGAADVETPLPPELVYWRDFGARYVTAVCTQGQAERGALEAVPPPVAAELESLAAAVPPMPGAEYLTAEVLANLWRAVDQTFHEELARSTLPLQEFLRTLGPAWHLVGRVHLNLAENRKDPDLPFAFLATYTTSLSTRGARARHLPLGRALGEYAGAAEKPELLSLLLPLQRAAGECPWLKALIESREIFHPLRWSPAEAFELLQSIPALESAGVIVRVPAAWRDRRPPRPRVTATVGDRPPAGLGTGALLDFRMDVTLDGETLSPDEIRALLASTDGLHLVRGRWIELDRAKLQQMLERFDEVERRARDQGLTFAEAMRLASSADAADDDALDAAREWSAVAPGPWLAELLEGLRRPEALAVVDPGRALQTTLRPYQRTGVRWLRLLSSLGLGACLADDMGLGKTIQVLALLLVLKEAPHRAHRGRRAGRGEATQGRRTSLLVAPASLLANWMAEIGRFAPDLRALVAHPSAMPAADVRTLDAQAVAGVDLVITSYGTLARQPNLARIPYRLLVVDEAQAIKNPATRQSQSVRRVDALARVALTGTPIENRLGDLWSIFDVINPGLLGSSREFTLFTRRLAARPHNPYGPLRDLVRPYILRRLKTDRRVIADLPDKTEVKAYCQLSRKQAALYQRAVAELTETLARTSGIERKGLVLAFLMRLKQICNHPSHWLGDNEWAERDSGKLTRLREIGEEIAARQEKALVFTQFREMAAPLAGFLAGVFGRPGLVLHGDTVVRSRQKLVERFQRDETVPFFVLSLKAGGTGLNLTAASHVIHFDRWWNPAVEHQATDRAFRIGQKRAVLVHKFLCRGTVEEKIDALLDTKQKLSDDILAAGAELPLTELPDEELLSLVSLDLRTAVGE